MGCDIHLHVEVKEDSKWSSKISKEGSFYSTRNYNLFAILANVRNDWSKDGYEFRPIDEPRGLPADTSPEVRAEAEGWYGDGHSYSWFTLQELLDYNWTQITIIQGMVSAYEFFRWTYFDTLGEADNESPEGYSGGVGGGGTKIIKRKEMEERISNLRSKLNSSVKNEYHGLLELIQKNLTNYYCQVEWKQPYYKCARYFWSDCIPRLLRLGEPENVRIVFWFDN